jgi:hypothetical protein
MTLVVAGLSAAICIILTVIWIMFGLQEPGVSIAYWTRATVSGVLGVWIFISLYRRELKLRKKLRKEDDGR